MNKQINTAIAIASIIIIAGAVEVFFWYNNDKIAKTTPRNTTTKDVSQNNIQKLKTFQGYGFEFQYQSNKVGENFGSVEFDIVDKIDAVGQITKTAVAQILKNKKSDSICEAMRSAYFNGGNLEACRVIKKGDAVIVYFISNATPHETLTFIKNGFFVVRKDKVVYIDDVVISETAAKYEKMASDFLKNNPNITKYNYGNKKWEDERSHLMTLATTELSASQSKEVNDDLDLLKKTIDTLIFTKK